MLLTSGKYIFSLKNLKYLGLKLQKNLWICLIRFCKSCSCSCLFNYENSPEELKLRHCCCGMWHSGRRWRNKTFQSDWKSSQRPRSRVELPFSRWMSMQSRKHNPIKKYEFRFKRRKNPRERKYWLLVRYPFLFDSFGASKAVYRSLWYIKSPMCKVICLLWDRFVISAQTAQKSRFWLPNINTYLTSRE